MLILPLKVHKRVVAKFKRRAKELWPKECFAYLLGSEQLGYLDITDVYVPEDIEKHVTKDSVFLQDSWVPEVLDFCDERELTPLGSIHSHPYSYAELNVKGMKHCNPDHSTSEADAKSGLTCKVHGICRVLESKNGRLTASIRFWGPEIPVDVLYV